MNTFKPNQSITKTGSRSRKGGCLMYIFLIMTLAFIILVAVAGWTIYRAPGWLIPTIESNISDVFNNRHVSIDSLTLARGLSMKNLVISDIHGGSDLLNVGNASLRIRLLPLLQRRVIIDNISLSSVTVNIEHLGDNFLSIDDLSGATPGIITAFSQGIKTTTAPDHRQASGFFAGHNHQRASGFFASHNHQRPQRISASIFPVATVLSASNPAISINRFSADNISLVFRERNNEQKLEFTLANVKGHWDGRTMPVLQGQFKGPGDLDIVLSIPEQTGEQRARHLLTLEHIHLDFGKLWQAIHNFRYLDNHTRNKPSELDNITGIIKGNLNINFANPADLHGRLSVESLGIQSGDLLISDMNMKLLFRNNAWHLEEGRLLFVGQPLTFEGSGALSASDGPPLKRLELYGDNLDASAISRALAADAPPLPPDFPPARLKAVIVPEDDSIIFSATVDIPGLNIEAGGPVHPVADVLVQARSDLKTLETLLTAIGAPLESIEGQLELNLRLPSTEGVASLKEASIRPVTENPLDISAINLDFLAAEGRWDTKGTARLVWQGYPEIRHFDFSAAGDAESMEASLNVQKLGEISTNIPLRLEISSFKPLKSSFHLDSTNLTLPVFMAFMPDETQLFQEEYQLKGHVDVSGQGMFSDEGVDLGLNILAAGASIQPPFLRNRASLKSRGHARLNMEELIIPALMLELGNSTINVQGNLAFDDMSLHNAEIWTHDLFLEDIFKSLYDMPIFMSGRTDIRLDGEGTISDFVLKGTLRCAQGLFVIPLQENWDSASEKRDLSSRADNLSDDFFRIPFNNFEGKINIQVLSGPKVKILVDSFRFDAFDGTIDGNAEISLFPELDYRVNFNLHDAAVAPFLELNTKMGSDAITGKLAARGYVYGAGAESTDMKGEINYEVDGAVIRSFLPFGRFIDMMKLPALERMRVEALHGRLIIKDGALHTEELFVESDLLHASGKGSMGFDKEVNADFSVQFMSDALAGSPYAGLTGDVLDNRSFRVRVRGPLDNPRISADLDRLLLQMLKDQALRLILPTGDRTGSGTQSAVDKASEAAAAKTREVKSRLEDEAEQARSRLEEKAEGASQSLNAELQRRILELEAQIENAPPLLRNILLRELERIKGENQ